MNDNIRGSSQRSPWDFAQFAIAVIGFFLGSGGAILASIPAAISGFVLMAFALAYFSLKGD